MTLSLPLSLSHLSPPTARPSRSSQHTTTGTADTLSKGQHTQPQYRAAPPETAPAVAPPPPPPSPLPQQQQQHQRHTTTTTSMDESAHTFSPNLASASGHTHTQTTPLMITDALSDVRVQYHIEAQELGHGHYGIVRKCMHRTSHAQYAIKSIRKSKVSKIEVLKREIEILKEVDHPNIIQLKEVYEDERYLHLITELCTGGELLSLIHI